MIEIEVQVEDWDSGESKNLILPCDVGNKIDITHDLCIVDYEDDIAIECDDIVELNNIIEDINTEFPTMTTEILNAIIENSVFNIRSRNDNSLLKLLRNDFMLEEIDIKYGEIVEERCAYYLAKEMMIPFAKNITENKLKEICSNPDNIIWEKVWEHYKTMGFKIFNINKKIYVFNWEDSPV